MLTFLLMVNITVQLRAVKYYYTGGHGGVQKQGGGGGSGHDRPEDRVRVQTSITSTLGGREFF